MQESSLSNTLTIPIIGAGGQNVNKVNTQVILKLDVMGANWIPHEVRQRIKQNEANKINKDGLLIITSQEYRTQSQNRKDAFDKLQELILKNYPRPKVRKMRKGISKKAKAINKDNKTRILIFNTLISSDFSFSVIEYHN